MRVIRKMQTQTKKKIETPQFFGEILNKIKKEKGIEREFSEQLTKALYTYYKGWRCVEKRLKLAKRREALELKVSVLEEEEVRKIANMYDNLSVNGRRLAKVRMKLVDLLYEEALLKSLSRKIASQLPSDEEREIYINMVDMLKELFEERLKKLRKGGKV